MKQALPESLPWEEVVASVGSLETREAEAIAEWTGWRELTSLRTNLNLYKPIIIQITEMEIERKSWYLSGGGGVGDRRGTKLEERGGSGSGSENLLVAEEGEEFVDALHIARNSVDLPATEVAILIFSLSLPLTPFGSCLLKGIIFKQFC